jgi:hypothetical protein
LEKREGSYTPGDPRPLETVPEALAIVDPEVAAAEEEVLDRARELRLLRNSVRDQERRTVALETDLQTERDRIIELERQLLDIAQSDTCSVRSMRSMPRRSTYEPPPCPPSPRRVLLEANAMAFIQPQRKAKLGPPPAEDDQENVPVQSMENPQAPPAAGSDGVLQTKRARGDNFLFDLTEGISDVLALGSRR